MADLGSIDVLLEQTRQEAIAAAADEFATLVTSGGITPKNHIRIVTFLAQKWGISPDDLDAEVKRRKVEPLAGKPDFRDLVISAFGMVLHRVPEAIAKVAKRLKIQAWNDGPPDDPEEAEAEIYPDPPAKPVGLRMFKPGMTRKYGYDVAKYMTVIAHELWHAFSDHYRVYDKVLKVLDGEIKDWGGIGKVEADYLMGFILFVEASGITDTFMEKLKKKLIKGWGVKYTLETADLDAMNGVLRRIKNPRFRGIFDEAMGEALAQIAAGGAHWVPVRLMSFVLEFGGVSDVLGIESTNRVLAGVTEWSSVVGNKKCDATGGYNAFTWNQEKRAWDLCAPSEEIMWSPWGHVGERRKRRRKNETGTLGFIARRGMLPSPERAV